MNILTPSITGSLKITHTMWEDFLCDPVMAAWVICGYKLDAFQAARLRYYWWVPTVIDSSGFSSGKTVVDFIFAILRAILLPDQEVAVYYPTHGTGKDTFWKYFEKCPGRIFRSQMGELNQEGEQRKGSKTTESGDTWKAHFLNGNTIYLPAPNFARDASSQASKRFNTLIIEEWTHVDASSSGIDDQLVGRNTRESWNQHHPIWGNHLLLTAPAKTRMHPAFNRWQIHQRECDAGNPEYANLHYSYKDYSRLTGFTGKSFREEYRTVKTIEAKRLTTPKADWLGEGLGIWGISGKGWFTEEAILQCVANGKERGVLPVLSRKEFETMMEQAGRG